MPHAFHILILLCVLNYVTGNVVIQGSQLNKLSLKSGGKDATNPSNCFREAKCEPLKNATCFNTAMPYALTSWDLAEDSNSLLEIQDNLAFWQGLQTIPRCWAVVQPLLCAVYMPKCVNGSISLPSQEMCKITRTPCQAVKTIQGWPPFLQCENKQLFPPGCRNPLQEVKFNTTSKCIPPLVETSNPDSWYEGIEGCGLPCQNPYFTTHEHEQVHTVIFIFAVICFGMNLAAVLTYTCTRKSSAYNPLVILVYMNFCFCLASWSWLNQFFAGARESIVCELDGTIRQNSVWLGQHLCSFTFVLIYFSTMATLVWFVVLAYTSHVLFNQSENKKESLKKKQAYFHVAAWCFGLVMTTIVMALTGADGDSMTGLCFIGYANPLVSAYVLVPVGVAAIVGGVFLVMGFCNLLKMKFNRNEATSNQERKILNRTILIILGFCLAVLVILIIIFSCYAYQFMHQEEWKNYLRDYIVCRAMSITSSESSLNHSSCNLKSRPNISVILLQAICFFGFGIVISLWILTPGSRKSWRMCCYRCWAPPEHKAFAIKKHKLIAKAFQKHHERNPGHYSFSLSSACDDPLRMDLEANSVASHNLSNSWIFAFPKLLERRNAIPNIGPLGVEHCSSASDVSARRFSLDSFRQQNLDSLSLQMSEMEYAHVIRHQRRKTRKERERFLHANRIAPWFPKSRRSSDTSLQSSIIAASLTAAAAARIANNKVTTATSTSDLNPSAPQVAACTINRQLTQRMVMPNLPFTHGMTNISHCVTAPPRKLVPETGYLNVPPTANRGAIAAQSPFAALYNQNFGYMPMMPMGHMPNGTCSNSLFTGYLPFPNNVASYMHYQVPQTLADQCGQHLIPLNPMADSASEAEYLPIFISDSEITDGGHRSYDEFQLLAARKLVEEHERALQEAALLEDKQMRSEKDLDLPFTVHIASSPILNVTKFAMAEEEEPLSGKISPCSVVPPPSPVDSENLED